MGGRRVQGTIKRRSVSEWGRESAGWQGMKKGREVTIVQTQQKDRGKGS